MVLKVYIVRYVPMWIEYILSRYVYVISILNKCRNKKTYDDNMIFIIAFINGKRLVAKSGDITFTTESNIPLL